MDSNPAIATRSDKLPLKFCKARTVSHHLRSQVKILPYLLLVCISIGAGTSDVSANDKFNQNENKPQETIDADDTEKDDLNSNKGLAQQDKAVKPAVKGLKEEVGGQEEEEEDDDEDPPQEEGQLSGFINTEATHDWLGKLDGDSQTELSANLSSLITLQITSNLKLGFESSFETEGRGQYFALESPSLFLNTLTIAYAGELGELVLVNIIP